MLYLENLGKLNLKVYQDDGLYKFTSDSILLSKFARVKPKDEVADFCAGSGIVGFQLYSLNPEKIDNITFFEMQSPLADICRKSIELNGLSDKFSVVNTRLQDVKDYNERFSLIVVNPPYRPENSGETDKDEFLAVCKTELKLKLDELISAVKRCLKFGGRVSMVHRADRTAEVIYEMKKNGIEPKRLQLVCPQGKNEPYLLLIEGVKGGKSGIKIMPTIYN